MFGVTQNPRSHIFSSVNLTFLMTLTIKTYFGYCQGDIGYCQGAFPHQIFSPVIKLFTPLRALTDQQKDTQMGPIYNLITSTSDTTQVLKIHTIMCTSIQSGDFQYPLTTGRELQR